MTEDITYTCRFVADSDTGERMALAVVSMRQLWMAFRRFLVFFTVTLTVVNRAASPEGRIFWGLTLALLPTLFFTLLGATVRYRQMVRSCRVRLYKGAILESGFGEKEMVLRTPIASSRLAYRGVRSVTARGDFVFLQYHGIPTLTVYPRELFPDEAISRIRLSQREAVSEAAGAP